MPSLSPNLITALRMVITVPIIFLLTETGTDQLEIVLCLMILCEATDWADGYVARKRGLVSDLGKILDPLADAFYRGMVFIALMAIGLIPVWAVFVFTSRDLFVAYGRVLAARSTGPMAARSSGKWKAVAQGVCQFSVIGAHAIWGGELPANIDLFVVLTVVVAAAVTLFSLFDYGASVLRGLGDGAWR